MPTDHERVSTDHCPMPRWSMMAPPIRSDNRDIPVSDDELWKGKKKEADRVLFEDNKYPYISAIVEHHMRPTTVRLPERPIVPTTGTISTVTNTGTNVQRPARFDTSTTTLDDHEQRPYWSDSHGQGPAVQPRPDGYIRPVTPDAGVVRIGLNISTNGHAEPPESPTIYRSSTTIYTRDKNQWVEHDDGRTTYVEKKSPPVERREDPIVIPPKIRYTPPIKRDEHLDEDNIVQEEHYEVSYQYERQVEEYSYESNLNQRYTGRRRSHPTNSLSSSNSALDDIEREHSYQHSPRSFIDQREEHFRQGKKTSNWAGETKRIVASFLTDFRDEKSNHSYILCQSFSTDVRIDACRWFWRSWNPRCHGCRNSKSTFHSRSGTRLAWLSSRSSKERSNHQCEQYQYGEHGFQQCSPLNQTRLRQ